MTKIDMIYIDHILGSIERIERFVEGLDRISFMENEMVQSAVIRELEVIGEASKKLSQDTKDRFPSVPWRRIAGMRDKLIHDYMGVDLEAVWDTISYDLHDLKRKISPIKNE